MLAVAAGVPLVDDGEVHRVRVVLGEREVGGDGAIYFDPTSVEHIADTIRRCLADTTLRSQLILKGRENLSRFSWNKTARETLSVYQDVFKQKNERDDPSNDVR